MTDADSAVQTAWARTVVITASAMTLVPVAIILLLPNDWYYLHELSRYVVLTPVRAGMTGGAAVNGRGAATPR